MEQHVRAHCHAGCFCRAKLFQSSVFHALQDKVLRFSRALIGSLAFSFEESPDALAMAAGQVGRQAKQHVCSQCCSPCPSSGPRDTPGKPQHDCSA